MVIKQIHEAFDKDFFSKPKDEVCGEMKRELSMYLNTDYDVSHFEALHDLGYLPIAVKSIEEGSLVPMRTPVLTIYNTHPGFYWITNYLETVISNLLWKPMTSATIAHAYRKLFTTWQEKTDAEKGWFVDWQAHDFSMRGLDSIDATISSGLGHLTSFSGSDSLPAIFGARKFYNEEGFVSGSVNATEHSVMCAGSKEDEVGTFRNLMETYPTGILSIVSDTWDLFKVCTEHIVTLKEEILARDGKLVIRPDSGDPVDIICGDRGHSWNRTDYTELQDENGNYLVDFYGNLEYNEGKVVPPNQYKGVIELLWDVFGGTINEQGYKVLDSHIGAIYGDSITLDRAEQIFKRLEAKGFASTNIVLGVGSFTYQFNTRDTFGFAMKATYVEVDGVGREIFKDPITDDGVKKSAKGLLHVTKHNENGYMLVDKVSWETEANGELQTIYKDGQFENQTTLTEIRERLKLV
jgi:nicotinamide phosphoribosyltransferase